MLKRIGYKCAICGRKYKKYSKHIEKHFKKHHPDCENIKLIKIYENE